MSDLPLISADSHVVEEWDLWQKRVPSEYRDRAPQLVREDDSDRLVCEDVFLPPIGIAAGVFRSHAELRREGRWDEDIPACCYDPEARMPYLDADGVQGEVLFPTIGLMLFAIDDLDFKWALFRAYNDWLAEFCSVYPQRTKGIAVLAHEDVDLAVAELERVKGLGLAGVMVPTAIPADSPPYHHPHYDRLWHAAVDHGMPVHVHSGTSADKAKAYNVAKGRNPLNVITRVERIQNFFLSMFFGAVFDRVPGLQLVSAENDAGWLADLLNRADAEWSRYQNVPRIGFDVPSQHNPSHYWRENCHITFMNEPAAVLTRNLVGAETLMFQTDFPHGVSTYPGSQALVDKMFDGVDVSAREQLTNRNAAALYGF
jgi:predicted TIM-barrel fold metal-dependent hydrolase